jgi:hypothetical protein
MLLNELRSASDNPSRLVTLSKPQNEKISRPINITFTAVTSISSFAPKESSINE